MHAPTVPVEAESRSQHGVDALSRAVLAGFVASLTMLLTFLVAYNLARLLSVAPTPTWPALERTSIIHPAASVGQADLSPGLTTMFETLRLWLVNLAPAVVGVRLATFVLATALGIIPGTFAYALVGGGLDSVIAAQQTAYRACIAAGRPECHLDFSMSALITPQILAAFAALGVVALITVVVRKWRARRRVAMPG